jgi:hypothetical protein
MSLFGLNNPSFPLRLLNAIELGSFVYWVWAIDYPPSVSSSAISLVLSDGIGFRDPSRFFEEPRGIFFSASTVIKIENHC